MQPPVYADLNLKSWIDAGKVPGPKIHVTGPYLEGQGNFRLPVHELSGPEDASKTVEFWADQGVTSCQRQRHTSTTATNTSSSTRLQQVAGNFDRCDGTRTMFSCRSASRRE
jgi:hypothetical protein